MIDATSMKPCSHLKSNEKDSSGDFVNVHDVNCKDCIYFSSRNCGRDAVSVTEPNNATFM